MRQIQSEGFETWCSSTASLPAEKAWGTPQQGPGDHPKAPGEEVLEWGDHESQADPRWEIK